MRCHRTVPDIPVTSTTRNTAVNIDLYGNVWLAEDRNDFPVKPDAGKDLRLVLHELHALRT